MASSGCHSPRRPCDRRPLQLCSAQRGQLEEAALMRGTVRQGRGEESVRTSECADWDSASLYVSTDQHSVPAQAPGSSRNQARGEQGPHRRLLTTRTPPLGSQASCVLRPIPSWRRVPIPRIGMRRGIPHTPTCFFKLQRW